MRAIAAYKGNPNLKDMLVRAKMPRRDGVKIGQGNMMATNYATKKTYKLQGFRTLKHANCVYLIRCHLCRKDLYVGETQGTLAAHLACHQGNIRGGLKTSTLLVKHFVGHGVENLFLRGIQQDHRWSTDQREKAERFWIQKLGTLHPKGLNMR